MQAVLLPGVVSPPLPLWARRQVCIAELAGVPHSPRQPTGASMQIRKRYSSLKRLYNNNFPTDRSTHEVYIVNDAK